MMLRKGMTNYHNGPQWTTTRPPRTTTDNFYVVRWTT